MIPLYLISSEAANAPYPANCPLLTKDQRIDKAALTLDTLGGRYDR
jgi:hypothetical protein